MFCITMTLSARGNKDKTPAPNIVKVTGIVRLVGSSLFTDIVITGSSAEWYITKDEQDKLHDLQHRTVTVEGEETVTEMTFASGLPAGTRRTLKNIRIITVE